MVVFYLSDMYLEMELLSLMVDLALIFKKASTLFSTVLHQFIFPSTVLEGSLFSTSFPMLLFDDRYFDR